MNGMLDEKDSKKRGLDQEVEEAAVRAALANVSVVYTAGNSATVACRVGLKLLDFHARAKLPRQSPIQVLAQIFLA